MTGKITISKGVVLVNSAGSILAKSMSIGVLVWVQQYLIKHVAVEEYSLLPPLFSMMVMLPFLTQVLKGGLRRYLLAAYDQDDDLLMCKLVSSVFPLFLVGALVLALLGSLAIAFLDTLLNIPEGYLKLARSMLAMILAVEILSLPLEAFSNGLYVKQRFILEHLIHLGAEIFRSLLIIGLLFAYEPSVLFVVLASFIASIAESLMLLLASLKVLPEQRYQLGNFDWALVSKLVRFGSWSSLYGMAGMVRKTVDSIILNRLAAPLDVACFHLGSLVPNRMEVLVNQSIAGSISPVIVGLQERDQVSRLKNAYLRIGRFTLWGVCIVIAPFLVHHQLLSELYVGQGYRVAGEVLVLLLLTYPFVYGNILHTSLANAKLKMRGLAIRESISTFGNIALTLLFVGPMQLGATGSALVTFFGVWGGVNTDFLAIRARNGRGFAYRTLDRDSDAWIIPIGCMCVVYVSVCNR